MRLLLDTHILLWTILDSPRLPLIARGLIDSGDHSLIVSVVSIWEIAIKHARGSNRSDAMPLSGRDMLTLLETHEAQILNISAYHAAAVENLRLIHRDPFDRMLVAQAQCEGMTLLTHDKALAAYGDFVITV